MTVRGWGRREGRPQAGACRRCGRAEIWLAAVPTDLVEDLRRQRLALLEGRVVDQRHKHLERLWCRRASRVARVRWRAHRRLGEQVDVTTRGSARSWLQDNGVTGQARGAGTHPQDPEHLPARGQRALHLLDVAGLARGDEHADILWLLGGKRAKGTRRCRERRWRGATQMPRRQLDDTDSGLLSAAASTPSRRGDIHRPRVAS